MSRAAVLSPHRAHSMPLPPLLDQRSPCDDAPSDDVAEAKTPFKLSQLDLGSIGRKSGGNKRQAAAAALDDDDDPREEAQVSITTTFCYIYLSVQLLLSALLFMSSRLRPATCSLQGSCRV